MTASQPPGRPASTANEWTVGPTGRSNTSPEFERLAAEVGRLLRDSAHDLIRGRTDDVGRLILAQLAHVHGLAPARAHGHGRQDA